MLTEVSKQLCALFGIDVPIIQAPMAGGPARPELVVAVSNAGGLGSLGAGYWTAKDLAVAIGSVAVATTQPYSVNVFVSESRPPRGDVTPHVRNALEQVAQDAGAPAIDFDAKMRITLEEQVDLLCERKVPVVSSTFGILSPTDIARLKSTGTLLIGTATCTREAVELERAGYDAIVAQGFEAGGHRGTFDATGQLPMVGLFALIPQIVDAVRLPVIAAGGIADGRGVAAALALGAAGVQIGTAFLVTPESGAQASWKNRVLRSNDEDTTITRAITGRPARGIRNTLMRALADVENFVPDYPITNTLTSKLRQHATAAGDSEYMSLWAGQSGRLSREMPAGDLVREIVKEAGSVIAAFGS